MSSKLSNLLQVGWITLAIALAITWRPEALVLVVLLTVCGPLLRELGVVTGIDERQRALDHQASHYALMLLYLFLFGIFAYALFVEDENPDARWYLVLIAPMVVRAMVSLGRGRGSRKLGLGLGFTFGAGWTLFAVLSHGLSVEALIGSATGGSLVAATACALRWPRLGGALLILIGLAFAVVFFGSYTERTAAAVILMAIILPLPPFVAGLALFLSARRQIKDEFTDLRGGNSPQEGGKQQ